MIAYYQWLTSHPMLFIWLASLGLITIVCLIVFAGVWLYNLFAGQDEEEVPVYFVERKED